MKSLIYIALLIILMLTSAVPILAAGESLCNNVTEIPQLECEALVRLYVCTNGSGWSVKENWLVNYNPSEWYGVTVTSGHVTGLSLGGNWLDGSIPSELSDLTRLHILDLSDNQLNGSIPPELGNLTGISILDLRDDRLTGSIPEELGNITHLSQLRLGYNQLTGAIPSSLGNLIELRHIDLTYNQLSGPIPPGLGNLSSLIWIELTGNHLYGRIPSELGNLTNLMVLRLGGNWLSGDVPETFTNLVNLSDPFSAWDNRDGLDLDYNYLSVPPGYPDPAVPWQVFINQKDPDWHLLQGTLTYFFLPIVGR